MMVRLLIDTKHRGRTYTKGQIVDMPDMWAEELLEQGGVIETTEQIKRTNLIRGDYPKGARLLIKLPREG